MHEKEWGNQDLNLGPTDYESAALTAELLPPIEFEQKKYSKLFTTIGLFASRRYLYSKIT
jgi:hypothetical protein